MASVVAALMVCPVASAEPVRIDVRSQRMIDALSALAEQLKLQLVYDGKIVAGLTAPAVSGDLEPQAALDRILAGSGLRYRFIDSTTVTIEKSETDDRARVLGPVRVEGAETRSAVNGVNGSRDVTATEGTGSFTTGAMTIGTKSPRSLKDTSQSVSVITSERLEQQNINDFTQALQQAPGVSFAQGDTSLQTIFYSRGYPITLIQIDGGVPLTTGFAGGPAYFPQIDMSQYDHVELLRGAAGLFNGYGDPSGVINLVRKKPLDHAQMSLDAEWGRWDHYRAVLDATAPLVSDGKLRGRGVLTWQSNEHFYETAEDQKTLIYGVLDYDLTPTTLLSVGASHTSQDSAPWFNGLPRFQTGEDLRVPRDTCLCFRWNRWDFQTTETFGSIEQQIGGDWTAKLNLTHNQQESTRKVAYGSGTVNPVDNRGPRLFGQYNDFSSDQFSVEATLSGSFTIFGQPQEGALGVNRSDRDGGGYTQYAPLIVSSAAAPYQPYPGGPLYCTTISVCSAGIASPPLNVFAFDSQDPIFTEPRNPLPSQRYSENGFVQTVAFANLRLTAFDRLHLETGVRWSRSELKSAYDRLCTSIPATGTPDPNNCVGRQIGDPYAPSQNLYSGEEVSWPPSVALSYDLTRGVTAYLSYSDIYQDQSSLLTQDLEPLDPVTGENVELGVKWSGGDGRFNASLAVYRIEKKGFGELISPSVTEPEPSRFCCYMPRRNQTELSEGVDAELTGEILPGWQIAASYTSSRNEQVGAFYGGNEGQPLLTIQPEHLYKLWTSYGFGRAGATGWLSNLTISVGANGQSKGFKAGQTCPDGQIGQPRPDGTAPCLVPAIPFEFTVEPYTVVSGRVDYRLNARWFAALNLENIFDKAYYQSVGNVSFGNWYGSPRGFTLSLRGNF